MTKMYRCIVRRQRVYLLANGNRCYSIVCMYGGAWEEGGGGGGGGQVGPSCTLEVATKHMSYIMVETGQSPLS